MTEQNSKLNKGENEYEKIYFDNGCPNGIYIQFCKYKN